MKPRLKSAYLTKNPHSNRILNYTTATTISDFQSKNEIFNRKLLEFGADGNEIAKELASTRMSQTIRPATSVRIKRK